MDPAPIAASNTDAKRTSAGRPVAIRVSIVALLGVFCLLQLSSPCSEWRAWKASKETPGFHTLELRTRPIFCVDF